MEYREEDVGTKVRLAGAWATLIALYIYADFLSLYPGQLGEISRGALGPFDVSQVTLLISSLIVILPALMIVLSLILPRAISRSVNLVLAVLYVLINISNLIGETWVYYLLFGVIEILITVFIFFLAWRWQP